MLGSWLVQLRSLRAEVHSTQGSAPVGPSRLYKDGGITGLLQTWRMRRPASRRLPLSATGLRRAGRQMRRLPSYPDIHPNDPASRSRLLDMRRSGEKPERGLHGAEGRPAASRPTGRGEQLQSAPKRRPRPGQALRTRAASAFKKILATLSSACLRSLVGPAEHCARAPRRWFVPWERGRVHRASATHLDWLVGLGG